MLNDVRMTTVLIGVAGLLAFNATPAGATPYYLFDGDAQRAVEIDGGAVVRGFDIPRLGYPVAITSSIWVGNRDNGAATELKLDGTPTGATAAGGATISQLLDGTTDGAHNYGVTCCRGPNVVTIANPDWSNQQVLFNIGSDGTGIAYAASSNSLFVSFFGSTIINYSMTGEVLGSFDVGTTLVGLAFEQSTNTLWGWNPNDSVLNQYSVAGVRLQSQSVDVGSFGIFNPYGGEMAFTAGVPEPATWAMMITGFGAIGATSRRRRGHTLTAA